MTDAINDISQNLTIIITENFINNNKAKENLNERILELMDNKGLIAPYSASTLVNLNKPENKSQFRLKKDLISNKMNDFLINDGV